MAITCALTLNTYGGLSVPGAYIRVNSAETFKSNVQPDPEQPRDERQFVRYNAETYLDAAARAAARSPLDRGSAVFEWDLAEPNVLAACYAHLKAQDAYAAATDC